MVEVLLHIVNSEIFEYVSYRSLNIDINNNHNTSQQFMLIRTQNRDIQQFKIWSYTASLVFIVDSLTTKIKLKTCISYFNFNYLK